MYRPCNRGEAKLERPTSVSYAEQVEGQAGNEPSRNLTCVRFVSLCRQTTLWYFVGDKRRKSNGRKGTRASLYCAVCDNKRKDEEMSCVVTMRHGRGWGSCMVFVAESSSGEQCENFLDAVTMANNAYERKSKVEGLESPSEGTMHELVEMWHEWRG